MRTFLRPLFRSYLPVDRFGVMSPARSINPTARRGSQSLVAGRSPAFCGLRQGVLAAFRKLLPLLLAVFSWILAASTSQAQGFIQQTGADNPFDNTVGNNRGVGVRPTLADLDGDGDLDLLSVDGNGDLFYYRNTGTKTSPSYRSDASPISLPTEGVAYYLGFQFGDLDGDGDLDAVTGNSDGVILAYRNTGSKTNPVFSQLTGASNPFADFDFNSYTGVSLADFDLDGDLDLLVLSTTGQVHYLRNTGSPTRPVYAEVTGPDNPFTEVVKLVSHYIYTPAGISDLDGDGDLDLVISTYNGIDYYQNSGTKTNPVFVQLTGATNPFTGFFQSSASSFAIGLGDVDGDGDADAILGFYGSVWGQSDPLIYLKNVLTVPQQPSPASQSVCAGASVSTTVRAAGAGPFTYQWYRNSPTTTTPVTGQTSAALNLTNVQVADSGLYYARVSGGGGVVFSTAFGLTVVGVAVTQQPASASTVCTGTSINVPVLVSGTVSTYQWYKDGQPVSNQTSPTLTLSNLQTNQSGSYSLVAIGNCNTVTTTAFALTVNPEVHATLTASGTITCANSVATLTATSGAGFMYVFSNGATPVRGSNTATVTQAGTYSVTVTVPNGCSASASVNVTGNANDPITVQIATPNGATLSCNRPMVLLTSTALGGTYFRWSNGDRNPYTNAQQAGVYSLTVTAPNGCSGVASVEVTGSTALPPVNLTKTGDLACTNPVVTLTATSQPGVTYTFSTGATQLAGGNTATVAQPGDYRVTVTGPSGCVNGTSIFVGGSTDPPSNRIDAATTTLSCQTPSVTLSAKGGSTCQWSTGSTNYDLTVREAGVYSVTVTGPNGCTAVGSVTVTGNTTVPTVSLTASGELSFSNPLVTLLATSDSGVTYAFGAGATQINGGNTATVTQAGTYSVTVTSANGCSAAATVTVTDHRPLYVRQGATGGGTSWDRALGDLQTAINQASAGQQIWVAAGEYQPASGQSFILKEGVKIYGGFANSGSPAFADRNWNLNTTVLKGNGSHVVRNDRNRLTNAALLDGFTLTGGSAQNGGGIFNDGAYPLINHCVFRANQARQWGGGIYNAGAGTTTIANCLFERNQAQSGGAAFSNASATPQLINVTIVNNSATENGGAVHNYQGAETELINAIVWGNRQVRGSSPLFTFESGQTKAYFSILEGGVQAIIGNKTVAEILPLDPLFVDAAGGDYRLQACSPAINSGTGSVISGELTTDLAAANRTYGIIVDLGAYEYQAPIQTGAERLAASGDVTTVNLESGQTQYIQAAADACRSVAMIESNGSSPLSGPLTITTRIDSQLQTYSCSPYVQRHYDIAAASGTQTASVTLYVTQAEFDAFNQAVPASGQLPSGPQDVGSRANLRVYQYGGRASGGNGPGAYSGTLVTIDPVDTDIHWDYGLQRWSVRVGVSGLGGFFVGSVSSPLAAQGVSLSASGSLSCSNPTVTLTASPSTGSTYQFSSGATQIGNGPTATVSQAGVYSVTVVSSDGCSATASTTVVGDQSVPTVTLTNSGPLSCTASSVTLTASSGGGYRFSAGASQVGSGPTATVSAAGVYSVTVTAANGCSATAQTTVVSDQVVPTATLTNNGPLSCSTTRVTLTASGGSTYRFSTGATQVGSSPTATVSQAGVYSVTVVGTNGCSATASTTVGSDQTAPTASIMASTTLLSEDAPAATLTARVTAGSLFTYHWNTGQTTSAISVSVSGTYSLTVTGANGCWATASIAIRHTQSPFSCASGAVYQVAGSATGNSTLYRYEINTGTRTTLAALPLRVNAIGFDVDNRLWGYDQTGKTVLQIDVTGQVNALTIPNLPTSDFNAGAILPGGYLALYATNAARYYVVDVNVSHATYRQLVDPTNNYIRQTGPVYGTALSSLLAINDFAYDNTTNQLIALVNPTGGSNANKLVRLNPATGVVSYGASVRGSGIGGETSGYGAQFMSATGQLYVFANDQGKFYQIDPATATATFVSSSTPAANNDGASCPNAVLGYLVTISGTVFSDANGLSDETVNGSGTNLKGTLNAILYDNTTGRVADLVAVNADGSFRFSTGGGHTYTAYLTTQTASVGQSALPIVALPSSWRFTGEQLGSGAGSDGTPDGVLTIGVVNSNITQANFGLQPLADLTLSLYARPSTVYGRTPLTLVVEVENVGGAASQGLISVRLPKDAGLSLGFNPSAGLVNNRPVQNSDWSVDAETNADYYILTSRRVVAAGEVLSIGLTGTLQAEATSGVMTLSGVLVGGSGGEVVITNNTDAEKIDYFQQ